MLTIPPPALPAASAPYGSSLCPSCHAVAARRYRLGGWPACTQCGGQTKAHPDCLPVKKVKAKAAVIDMRAVDLQVFELCPTLFLQPSPMEYWTPDNECPHERLPHEPCDDCGRLRSSAPPRNIDTIVACERAII